MMCTLSRIWVSEKRQVSYYLINTNLIIYIRYQFYFFFYFRWNNFLNDYTTIYHIMNSTFFDSLKVRNKSSKLTLDKDPIKLPRSI